MSRENILALYTEAVESAEWPEGMQGYHDKEREHEIRIKEAFYHKAQAEAFEAAAKLCDASDKSTHPSDLADAIREMAKEMK